MSLKVVMVFNQLLQNLPSDDFRSLKSDVRKVVTGLGKKNCVNGFGKKSCVGTGATKPGNR